MTKSELKQKIEAMRDLFADDEANMYLIPTSRARAHSYTNGFNELLPLLLDAYEALDAIDKALTIPAAEYVPAIGDVFKIIDSVRSRIEAFANGEK